MPFPPSERVVYNKNPLNQVICQLRYPAILKISADAPVEFQEKIRKDFPLFEVKNELPAKSIDVASRLPPGATLRAKTVTAYEFASADKQWVLNLNADFLALTAHDYTKWEQFRKHIIPPFELFNKIYSLPFITRVGLRYQNIIRRTDFKLKDVQWIELLNPHLVALLADEHIGGDIDETAHQTIIKLDNHNANVRLQYALGIDTETKEKLYLIDSDFYLDEQTEIDHVGEILDYFNEQSRLLFRWAISDRLHNAMGPRAKPNKSKR
jgi:uncharacterized protein (TIGR04255 family)